MGHLRKPFLVGLLARFFRADIAVVSQELVNLVSQDLITICGCFVTLRQGQQAQGYVQ